jgi:anaerobic magnesium-protoporphyrin IX monomethyl ester cyclase
MKPRVLLFNLPPSGGDFFPISLGYIAASLVKQGIEPAVAEIDRITPRTGQSIANFVLEFRPQAVGFSVYQDNTRLAVQLAKLVKMIDPGILVVIGGPQATFMPTEALLQMPDVDVICRGEGELVMPALVKCLIKGGGLSHVKGISFRDTIR